MIKSNNKERVKAQKTTDGNTGHQQTKSTVLAKPRLTLWGTWPKDYVARVPMFRSLRFVCRICERDK